MRRLGALLGALRGAAHEGPSPRSWRRLVSLCEALRGDEEAQVALDYLRPTLAGWPERQRALTWRDWLRHEAPPVIWPLVACLHLKAVSGPGLDKLRRWCEGGVLRRLRLTAPGGDLEQRRLEAILPRATLRALALRGSDLGDATLAHILGGARAEGWPCLERLDVSYNRLQGACFSSIYDNLPQLRQLEIGHNPLWADALAEMATLRHPRLEALHLRGVVANIDTFEALFEGRFPALRVVEMEPPRMDEAQAARWQRAQPPQAREVAYEEADALAHLEEDLRRGRLDGVKVLHLGAAVTTAQWAVVCASALPSLEVLEVRSAHPSAQGSSPLSRAPWRRQLKALWVDEVREAGVLQAVCQEAAWSGLEELAVAQRAPLQGTRALAESATLRALWSLWLRFDQRSPRALEEVAVAALRLGLERLALNIPMGELARWSPLALDGVELMTTTRDVTSPQHLKARRRGLQMGWTQGVEPRRWGARLPLLERYDPLTLLVPAPALTEEVARALAGLRLPGLQTLRLIPSPWVPKSAPRPLPAALEALLGSPWGLRLRRLELRGLRLDGAQAAALAAWRPAHLEEALVRVKALDAGVERALERAPWLQPHSARLELRPFRKR